MIVDFYENCEIFITGGSGVVGKAIIEKLLRSCNVKKIYILLRPKKGAPYDIRLEEIKKSRIFKVLKECKPNELNKLVAIPGDIKEDNLGIPAEYLDQLKNVSIFFHSAASTRFNDPLKTAISLNLKSTYEALKIGETMTNLKIFLHVSTYFSNPNLELVEDKVYPAAFDWRTALKILDLDDRDPTLDIITNKVITGFPNTYIFTKHLGEKLVDDFRPRIPVAIYKPSIVIAACDDPEEGFTETMTGIMGLMTIWGTGLLQAFYVKNFETALDFTPLDLGTKTVLIFTALKGQLPREKLLEATPVGKFSSLAMVYSPLCEYIKTTSEAVYKFPLEKSFWIPNVTVTSCIFIYWIVVIFSQLIPAILIDFILSIFRKKPFMMAIQRKIYLTRQALSFFIDNESRSDGITDVHEMRKISKGTDFDIGALFEYAKSKERVKLLIHGNVRGCRKFLLNEPDSSIERCRKILRAKIMAYNVLKGIVGFFIGRAIYERTINYLHENQLFNY
ncbi:fatty acyl-CoA reductase wat [Eupeodes corollae]|uniref:fatty acyl-CoA reductase wat n=1 Tax=Eupeodes corollae TaxID=290404 RepID=UPI00248FB2D1|nr:fatty acyl-CoA reductase wat [Eupeodes corollae]